MAANKNSPIVATYYPEWKIYNKQKLSPSNLPADKLSHLIYAFLAVCGPVDASPNNVRKILKQQCANKPIGTVVLFDQYATLHAELKGGTSKQVDFKGSFGQLQWLSEQYPALKILPSIGGWTLSEPFHTVALNNQYRQNFVNSTVALLNQYPFFDGIQIDWEYPGGLGLSKRGIDNREQEKHAFTQLISEVRLALDKLEKSNQRSYQLSAAVNASPKHINAIDWKKTAPQLDHLYVMTFDFQGGWSDVAGHHSNLIATPNTPDGHSAASQVNALIAQGVNRNQIVLGSPFYGRIWQEVEGFSPTLLEGLASGGASTKGSRGASGIFDYDDIARHFLANKKLGFEHYYDEKAEAAVLYSPTKQEYISFESARSLKAKTKFVKDNQLAGIFAWEITADYDTELLNIMHSELYDN
ncbi:chitinase [Photobacterium sanctipauli]|uniref:chitinase n=2 Tax=Photobacterium sanctipauli TaxID=1342794 RepID=A0A2T3NZ72_9GAMM|nr:chitinase [Photobacterium sanctipauli]